MKSDIRIDFKTINHFMNYIDLYGKSDRGFQIINSGDYEISYLRAGTCEGLTIQGKAKYVTVYRYLPNEYIDGNFYEMCSLLKDILNNDFYLRNSFRRFVNNETKK